MEDLRNREGKETRESGFLIQESSERNQRTPSEREDTGYNMNQESWGIKAY
jgi:hypothetical protein